MNRHRWRTSSVGTFRPRLAATGWNKSRSAASSVSNVRRWTEIGATTHARQSPAMVLENERSPDDEAAGGRDWIGGRLGEQGPAGWRGGPFRGPSVCARWCCGPETGGRVDFEAIAVDELLCLRSAKDIDAVLVPAPLGTACCRFSRPAIRGRRFTLRRGSRHGPATGGGHEPSRRPLRRGFHGRVSPPPGAGHAAAEGTDRHPPGTSRGCCSAIDASRRPPIRQSIQRRPATADLGRRTWSSWSTGAAMSSASNRTSVHGADARRRRGSRRPRTTR